MEELWQQAVAVVWDWRFAVAVACTAVAGVMRGYSGFGTAILLAPVYSTLWSPRTGVPVVLLMELFVSAYLLPRAFAYANKRLMGPICIAAVIAMPFGAVVLLQADGATLRRVIGGFVLVFGLLMSSSWRYHGTRPLGLNVAVGLVSGLLKGATGMAGPPVILYLLAGKEEAAQHRANLILYFGVLGVAAVLPPLWAGLIGVPALLMTALMLPVMLVSVPIGARLFHVVPLRWYRRLALALLVGAGLFALLG